MITRRGTAPRHRPGNFRFIVERTIASAFGPCGQPARARSRSPPARSPAGSLTAASPAARAAGPTRRPRSRPPDVSSTSCPSRSRFPGAGAPTGCRCAGTNRMPHKACRSGTRGLPSTFFGPGFGSNGSVNDHSSSSHLQPRLTPTRTYGQNRRQTPDQQLLLEPVRPGGTANRQTAPTYPKRPASQCAVLGGPPGRRALQRPRIAYSAPLQQ